VVLGRLNHKRLSDGACVLLSIRNSFALTERVLTTVVHIYTTLTECSIVFSYTVGLVLSTDRIKNSNVIWF
jgi:hypothetical protein